MKIRTVSAAEVKVNDYLPTNEPRPYHKARVTSVREVNGSIEIATTVWTTYKHPREGVALIED